MAPALAPSSQGQISEKPRGQDFSSNHSHYVALRTSRQMIEVAFVTKPQDVHHQPRPHRASSITELLLQPRLLPIHRNSKVVSEG
jgi:hypothetical protein